MVRGIRGPGSKLTDLTLYRPLVEIPGHVTGEYYGRIFYTIITFTFFFHVANHGH